ncbi:hypothetical protein B0H13DRAFT_2337078 [Mycena leptocephala]|nr:hypothetical protein B0H13DRAFT_2337078 [Mycena leptocephala]
MTTLPPAVIRSLTTFFLGGWDLAICADLVLQGIVFAQIAHYTTLYGQDFLALRAFVAVLLLITTLKSAHGLAILWTQNVEYFMNLTAALSMFTNTWTTEVNLALDAFIAFYVQLFFCRRLWVISRNVYIVGVVFTLFVFALIAAIVSCVFTFAGQVKNVTWIEIHLATVFAGDVLLCSSTIYFLLFHSKHAPPETAGVLNSITKLTFQSAAPAAVCALISLVGTVAWDRKTPNAYVMLAIIANNALPKLYAISAMWTLNSRRRIRQAHSSTGRDSTAPVSEPQHPNDIELGSLWVSTERSAPTHIQTEAEATGKTSRNAVVDREVYPHDMRSGFAGSTPIDGADLRETATASSTPLVSYSHRPHNAPFLELWVGWAVVIGRDLYQLLISTNPLSPCNNTAICLISLPLFSPLSFYVRMPFIFAAFTVKMRTPHISVAEESDAPRQPKRVSHWALPHGLPSRNI